MGTLFWVGPQVLARVGDWLKEPMNKVDQSRERLHSRLSTVIMDCRGLVDPRNKPFGRVLPLEVQVKIMFWVHCFYTMDKRKKVVQELKGLPKCSLTGFPQRLGEDRWWNQVVVRLHVPRKNGCHHCHRMIDHRLSVSDFFFQSHLLLMTLMLRKLFCLVFRLA